MNKDNEKLYAKMCAIHSDVSSIKTKIEVMDSDLKEVENKCEKNETFRNRVTGGLILLSSGVIIAVIKHYMV